MPGTTTDDTTDSPAGATPAPGVDQPVPPVDDTGDGDRPGRRGPAVWQVILLVVALCGLAGVIGWRVGSSEEAKPGADSVDVGFYTDMTTHHQQAITMALDYVRNGQDPLLLAVAKEIATYQASEIGMMQDHLADWGQDGTSSDIAMAWLGAPVKRGEMPGLATPAQLEALENARGAELDALWTELMINHHGGGVHMAADASRTAELASTRRWGQVMDSGQRGEISEMNQWRRQHGLDVVVPPLAEFTAPADTDH